MNLEQPKIDIKLIQEKANSAAEKAYLSAIEDYYTSYSSPYKEMIKEELKKQEFKWSMDLPNIMSRINKALSEEVDMIANNAIASSYIPIVSEALVGYKKQLKLSDILKDIVESTEPEEDVFDEFNLHISKSNHGWLNLNLSIPESYYEITLHTASENKYQLLSMPSNSFKKGGSNKKMTIFKDDVKIELPFTENILHDKVINIFFKMMLGKCEIEIDCDNFTDDMFPEDEFCHC